MKLKLYFSTIRAMIPCTKAYRVRQEALRSMKRFKSTLKKLNQYDQGETTLKDSVAGPSNLREYLQHL